MDLKLKVTILLFLNLVTCNCTLSKTSEYINRIDEHKIALEISSEIQNMKLPQLALTKNNKTRNVSLSDLEAGSVMQVTANLSTITFMLYTRKNLNNPTYLIADQGILESSHLNAKKQLKVLIHGWLMNGQSTFSQNIKNAYLEKYNLNVIVVDWGSISENWVYPLVVAQTKSVGNYAASFFKSLINFGVDAKNIHMIGFSLGCHVAAFIAENIPTKIGRITALDPALPGFSSNILSKFGGAGRLNPEHANFVDVIHTNGRTLGIADDIGHVDFYPNGGEKQPGCGPWFLHVPCSHERSWLYFEESISRGLFPAHSCKSKDPPPIKVLMGDPISPKARGSFCLETNNQSNFGLSKEPKSADFAEATTFRRDIEFSDPHDNTNSGLLIQLFGVYKIVIAASLLCQGCKEW